ncbi:MAG: hypothetical protein ACLGID_21125 [Gammaproteobacteria bacterium]
MENKIAILLSAAITTNLALAAQNKVVDRYQVKIRREILNMGPGCNISIDLPANIKIAVGNGGDPKYHIGGMTINPLPKKWNSRLGQLNLNLTCEEKDHNLNPVPSGAYDEKFKKWKEDKAGLREYLAQSQDYKDPAFLEEKLSTIRVNDVKTSNAHGWADTSDDITGDENIRRRYMSFCIYHGSKALCGLGQVARLLDGRQGDVTPHILKILRTIEFLD